MKDTEALDRIAALLDGAEWSAETTEHVAAIVAQTGRIIRAPEDVESEEEEQS